MTTNKLKSIFVSIALFMLMLGAANAQSFKVQKGTNCSEYFDINAKKEAGVDDIYISPKKIGFMSLDHVYGMYAFLVYTKGSLFLVSNVLKDHKMCLNASSSAAIKFENLDYVYVESGKHKQSCIPGRIIEEKSLAKGLHQIPVNSLMFKNLVSRPIELIALETDAGPALLAPSEADDKRSLTNLFRCAYEAIGGGIDLSDDSLLINNARALKKK